VFRDMRKIETVIEEVTNALPKEQLIYSDERAFLGVNDRDQKVAYVQSDQILVARRLLAGKPSGSKLHCYSYDALIHYRLENIGYDNPAFTLTHTFILIDHHLCAISNIDSETFLSETKRYSNDPMNPFEIERRAISRDEWNRVKMLFEFYKDDKQVLAGNKLRHRQKHYRVFEIADYEEEGFVSRRIVKMTHTFYHIDNKLYALAGNGHNVSGSFGKVKIARQYSMQSDQDYCSEAELVVLKIPKKIHTLSRETCANIRGEYALYQAVGLSESSAVKQKAVAANGPQEICVMRFFHSDLFDNVLEGHLRKLVSHIRLADSLPLREQLVTNLIRCVTEIFLKLLNQLGINIHQHQFLHRDIKPENIVLTTKPQTNSLGQVVSIKCVEAMFIDFGSAKKIQKPGEWAVSEEYSVGTKKYWAPEINCPNVSVRHRLCYTDKTEIYALGKTLKYIVEHLFSSILNFLSHDKLSKPKYLYHQLLHVANMMCFDVPAERLSLEYARILLLNALWQLSFDDSAMTLAQKKEAFDVFAGTVNSPFRHFDTLMCLSKITHLTGVMIMHRANTQSAVQSKTNLSHDFFRIFRRLDTLLAHRQYREVVLQLFEKINHALSQWDAAVSPSPIEIFERETRLSSYDILRNRSCSSEASYVDSLVSVIGALVSSTVSVVGGLFASYGSPARRERMQNNSDDDNFYP